MDPRAVLEENLGLIERTVARACRRVGIAADQVDDVASAVKLALVENDYAILRRYEGRSSLVTYLTIVIQRLLADQHERMHGRWRPSAEAQRLGEQAVLVEDIVGRQRRPIEEAVPLARSIDASLTREQIVSIAERLPSRAPRPREVQLPEEDAVPLAAADRADTKALDGERRELSRRMGAALRDAMAKWGAEDRLLVRLRFESSLTIADVARLMNVPQRPLYRRLESLLGRLRGVLTGAGVDPAAVDDLLEASQRIEIDFGLLWKERELHRTNSDAGRARIEEQPS